MDGITLKITGTLLGPINKMKEELPQVEKRALVHAAYYLRDKIRQSLVEAIPKATMHNPKYSDTLVDAVHFTKVDGASVNVNAMGNRKPKSGTFRTRFFERDTKDRYQKTFNGIKRKKKKFIGHITGTSFFSNAVNANQNATIQMMRDVISEYIQEWNK